MNHDAYQLLILRSALSSNNQNLTIHAVLSTLVAGKAVADQRIPRLPRHRGPLPHLRLSPSQGGFFALVLNSIILSWEGSYDTVSALVSHLRLTGQKRSAILFYMHKS